MCSVGGLQVGGAAFSAIGQMNQASAQQSALEAQSQVASNNATIDNNQAMLAIQNGQTAEQNSELRTASLYGTQRATMAANGVDLGSGSANDILTTTQFRGNKDALTIRDNALRQAWGYQVQAANDTANAQNLQNGADAISPAMSGFTSFLGSATSVASSWLTAKNSGTNIFKSFGS